MLGRSKNQDFFQDLSLQCRSIGNDLVTQSGIEMDTRGFLGSHIRTKDLEVRLTDLRERSMMDPLLHILIIPHELCLVFPVHADVVITMGTQYLEVDSAGKERSRRRLVDYSIQELIRIQDLAVRPGRGGAFHLFCEAEERDTFVRFFEDGIPFESTLL